MIQAQKLLPEITFTTSRSSGPGGQNVNKVNSKVTLQFDVVNSSILDQAQKDLLVRKLASRVTKDGILMLVAQESRSQTQNKEEVLQKLNELLVKAFAVTKPRKATKPTKTSKQKRIQTKKHMAEKKQWRKKL